MWVLALPPDEHWRFALGRTTPMIQQLEKGIDVADVYAAALFALAREARQVEAVGEELAELVKLVEHDPALASFLGATMIDDDERERSLERMLRGRLSDVVLNTLQVMNRHGRASLLHPLWRAYVLRAESARGQIEVLATAAAPLDDEQKAAVEKLAAELSGRSPLMSYVVDPGIIGGLVLEIGDWRLDNSVRQQLRTARARLLERSRSGDVRVGSSAEQ